MLFLAGILTKKEKHNQCNNHLKTLLEGHFLVIYDNS